MYDSHCHLHDDRMRPFWREAVARAREAGVRWFLLAGVEPEGWCVEDEMARQCPDLLPSYGVHPQIAAAAPAEQVRGMVAALSRTLAQGLLLPPVAIGEIGLDGLDKDRRGAWAAQEVAFAAQLGLAREHDLPVVLHVLRAHDRALRLLRREGVPRRGGVVHSYSGPAELVPRYLELGLYISFAGAVTYANARKAPAAVRAVPRERLLIETDAPDQAPIPHRGLPNEPAFLPEIADAVATIRGEPRDDVARYTAENARRLFGPPMTP